MFSENLVSLRKLNNLSQEELASELEVSRQTLSKWESGETSPDIEKCNKIADYFGVSLDDLVNHHDDSYGVPPRGKHIFGLVTIGDKGQMVIPAKARKIFKIEPGDKLLVLGDEVQGIAIVKEETFLNGYINVLRESKKSCD